MVRLAKENKSWGYDRIAGALANLGHEVADQTVGNILKRHGIPLAPESRKTTTWREFICSHMDALAATDFFTAYRGVLVVESRRRTTMEPDQKPAAPDSSPADAQGADYNYDNDEGHATDLALRSTISSNI